jgi:NAD(P)-dependent dehydrogenase (short-subunit alcohol dehydrogenase family)
MRAVITGGAGFIGSHLAERLLAEGHRVTVLDDLSTGSYHNIEHLLKRADFEFVLGSICNADVVDDVAARSDAVFHLAAAVGVQLIVEQPLESLMTNVRGSEVVMEKAHKHGCRVLVTSTSEIYGKNTSDRLGLQLAVGVGVWIAGIGVGVLPWQAANVTVTVVWVAGITNVFQLGGQHKRAGRRLGRDRRHRVLCHRRGQRPVPGGSAGHRRGRLRAGVFAP